MNIDSYCICADLTFKKLGFSMHTLDTNSFFVGLVFPQKNYENYSNFVAPEVPMPPTSETYWTADTEENIIIKIGRAHV